MSHLRINLTVDKGDYRLASYEISKYAVARAATRCRDNPEENIKNYLCSWYCFDPRITPEDIIEFKLMESSDNPNAFLIHLHLRKNKA